MKYYLASHDLYIEIRVDVFNQIQLQAEGEYPNENGGMLVGRYSTDKHTVYIENIVVPMEKLLADQHLCATPKDWKKFGNEWSKMDCDT